MVRIPEIFNIFNNKFYSIVFFIFLVIGTFLVPKNIFYNYWMILAVIFAITFALSMTYVVKNIKEKIAKTKHHSILGVVSAIFGISAFQVCNLGSCGQGVLVGLVLLFPSFFVRFLESYGVIIIIISIILQVIALIFMNRK
jgi:hypothetical protein